VLDLRSVKVQLDHVVVAGRHTRRVPGSVAQLVAFQLAVRLSGSAPGHLDADGRLFLDDLEFDDRAVGDATGRRRFLGGRASPVAFAGECGHLDRVGRVRLETADRVFLNGTDVVSQWLANNGILN
jgi:hypothetical protein